jgi:hypothetical protein
MARSSTRQALRKGGNFMGMMNVLMQLRKVCNHPDLFEPRSVVTPLALNPILCEYPSCVLIISDHVDYTKCLSDNMLSCLWCGSTGLPSFSAALRHDVFDRIEFLNGKHNELFSAHRYSVPLQTPQFPISTVSIYDRLILARQESHNSRIQSVNKISVGRCQAPVFPFSQLMLNAVMLRSKIHQAEGSLTTPSHLLKMIRSEQQLSNDMGELIKKFVFCVPKAGAATPVMRTAKDKPTSTSDMYQMLLEPLEEYNRPYKEAFDRLSSFFPDKKLVQFDSGKLQTLAELLRELKKGGHRALIFTQMSKMLDILEAFLNLNGHNYLRLDGATGVERRQRLMDLFNASPRYFCFILSTRSGGLGINLTGADTVIFFDSDWNPAMDAQAQDRAHRIGQTRDVHIFRLVTQHTIEENILMKARQKRNLDILVMDKGNFNASELYEKPTSSLSQQDSDGFSNIYTTTGLLDVLGVAEDDIHDDEPDAINAQSECEDTLTKEQMESAMASLEDADDVQALRGAQLEAAEELKEFDENIDIKREDEDDVPNDKGGQSLDVVKIEASQSEKDQEEQLNKELAAWQVEVGTDITALEERLIPAEKFALHFRRDIDPYLSIFAIMEQRRLEEVTDDAEREIDIDVIEREKALEEKRAIEEGDLLVTRPRPEDLVRQRNLYRREQSRLRANKKRRALTGENWEQRPDARTNHLFWYNVDSGEATWDKPKVLLENETYSRAYEVGWAALPLRPLINTLQYVPHHPDRTRASLTCRQWHRAATDPSFVLHVYPVEMGAYTREDRKMERNHYRTISSAVQNSWPGDTIGTYHIGL